MPRNIRNGERQSTLLTYIAAARGRPNFSLRGDSLVDRVLVDTDRPVAVLRNRAALGRLNA